MLTRDPFLEKFSKKFQHQTSWGEYELKDTSGEEKVRKVIQKV